MREIKDYVTRQPDGTKMADLDAWLQGCEPLRECHRILHDLSAAAHRMGFGALKDADRDVLARIDAQLRTLTEYMDEAYQPRPAQPIYSYELVDDAGFDWVANNK